VRDVLDEWVEHDVDTWAVLVDARPTQPRLPTWSWLSWGEVVVGRSRSQRGWARCLWSAAVSELDSSISANTPIDGNPSSPAAVVTIPIRPALKGRPSRRRLSEVCASSLSCSSSVAAHTSIGRSASAVGLRCGGPATCPATDDALDARLPRVDQESAILLRRGSTGSGRLRDVVRSERALCALRQHGDEYGSDGSFCVEGPSSVSGWTCPRSARPNPLDHG
jgi:hypothetical protein